MQESDALVGQLEGMRRITILKNKITNQSPTVSATLLDHRPFTTEDFGLKYEGVEDDVIRKMSHSRQSQQTLHQ